MARLERPQVVGGDVAAEGLVAPEKQADIARLDRPPARHGIATVYPLSQSSQSR